MGSSLAALSTASVCLFAYVLPDALRFPRRAILPDKLNPLFTPWTFAIVYLQYFRALHHLRGTTGNDDASCRWSAFRERHAQNKRFCAARATSFAGTFFLGFLWAMWDEDELTWHDRLSRTHLSRDKLLPILKIKRGASQ